MEIPTIEQRREWLAPHKQRAAEAGDASAEAREARRAAYLKAVADEIAVACKAGRHWCVIECADDKNEFWPEVLRDLQGKGYRCQWNSWDERGEYNWTQHRQFEAYW